MAHKLRQKKDCLNCGAYVADRYCPRCGQENVETKESFGELLYEFFADVTHFDSKLFKSLSYLFFRPGYLTKEYLHGRRKRYLHPIRMYIFISFIYFLTAGLLIKKGSSQETEAALVTEVTTQNTGAADSSQERTGDDTTRRKASRKKRPVNMEVVGGRYPSLHVYDSVQQALPAEKRSTGITRYVERKLVTWQEKYPGRYTEVVHEKFTHSIPTAMFVLLPLFALYLKWLHRKRRYYVDHAIFSLHFHSLFFILLTLAVLIGWIFKTDLDTYAYWVAYFYLIFSLRKVYEQSFVRSFFKSLLLLLLYFITIMIVFVTVALIVFVNV